MKNCIKKYVIYHKIKKQINNLKDVIDVIGTNKIIKRKNKRI